MLDKLFSGDKNNETGDQKDLRSYFCFLDESGSLHDKKDPFFTVGFLSCSQPYYINSKLVYERKKRNFYDEMKFNKLSKNNYEFAIAAVDAIFSTKSLHFSSYTLDKQGNYFLREFSGDPWKAYENISIRVLESAVPPSGMLIVIADYVSTPDYVRFEVNVKKKINEKLNKFAIAGVCRFDSKSNDLLQITDLMIGAINYDLKLSTGIIQNGDKHKRRFLENFKENLGAKNFADGFRNYNFNIFVDKDIKQRLLNEKGPSS